MHLKGCCHQPLRLAACHMYCYRHRLAHAALELESNASPANFPLQVMKAGAGADLPAADYFLRRWVPPFSEGVIEEVRKVGVGPVGQAGCRLRAETP